MSDAYYHRGITIEFDLTVPKVTIEGREVPTETFSGLFALSDPPSVKAKKLRRCIEQFIEQSPGFEKREATRLDHLVILKKGVPEWNNWRTENPTIRPLLYDSDLTKEALLVDLDGADFANAVLINADLTRQKLRRANFHEANLGGACLHKADLTGANFCRTDLYETSMSEAILNDANLQGTQLAKTNFEGAKLIGCKVYGMSAWDLKLTGAEQTDLVIRYRQWTRGSDAEEISEAQITVDDLEVAQFIYLLLNNEKIAKAIDTIVKKGVLILGRFYDERKAVLDALKERLRHFDLVPMVFDWKKPGRRDLTETVQLLANMSWFVVADVTDARSIPQELSHIVPSLPSVPVRPIILATEYEYSMFEHWTGFKTMLPVFKYNDKDHLVNNIETALLDPVKKWEVDSDKAKDLEKAIRVKNEEIAKLRAKLAAWENVVGRP